MEQKGITKKQFILQTASTYINLLLGVYWIVTGIQEHRPFTWISGIVFIGLSLALIISMYIQWRRHPVVDEELDRQITRDLKENMKGMGIFFGVIAFGFLLAFGLVLILT